MKNVCTERSRSGFTLIEILVVMGVLTILGTLVVTIFTRTLRGGNKSQLISAIKQNGQAVLETMDKTIRNADSVVCPPPSGGFSKVAAVKGKDGIYTRYKMIYPAEATNGYIVQDNPTQNPSEDIILFTNRICGESDPLNQPKILTDTNRQSGVSLVNGFFTRDQQPGYKDIVSINFSLTPGSEAPAIITGQIDPVTFQTTVELR